MLHRRLVVAYACLLAVLVSGCDKLTFLPQAHQKKATGYDAVVRGMSESQVRGILGEPSRRSGFQIEGGSQRGTSLTYVGGGKLITVTMVGGKVVEKQKY